ncbi:hypothetical protein [Roseateles albus]|uniref:Uncharacterized protein n=1 Tax=Roseateles albus TaxID=2987525 RepID=A0ABT5KM71_9BURK|nr:hypothetical protein [Roseateles albus]MDC8774554.1 hypothetical protein [Roseateles albus]
MTGLQVGLQASIDAELALRSAEFLAPGPAELGGTPDLTDWHAGLRALAIHLESADMAAMQDLEVLLTQSRILFGNTRPLQDLEEAVAGLDFERALTMCKVLSEEESA